MTDWSKLSADLERLLKLRSFAFGMKLYEDRAEMEAIPRIRRPKSVHTLDQVVGQAARLGWTIGITAEDAAQALLQLAVARNTTGSFVAVDGGNIAAAPR